MTARLLASIQANFAQAEVSANGSYSRSKEVGGGLKASTTFKNVSNVGSIEAAAKSASKRTIKVTDKVEDDTSVFSQDMNEKDIVAVAGAYGLIDPISE
jgi:hypothetical protein